MFEENISCPHSVKPRIGICLQLAVFHPLAQIVQLQITLICALVFARISYIMMN